MHRKLIATGAVLGMVVGSPAATAQSGPGWAAASLIASIIPTADGLNIVLPASDNPMGCASTTWARILISDPNYALISSTVLTAFSQGKPIKTYQAACFADGAARFTGVWVDR